MQIYVYVLISGEGNVKLLTCQVNNGNDRKRIQLRANVFPNTIVLVSV